MAQGKQSHILLGWHIMGFRSALLIVLVIVPLDFCGHAPAQVCTGTARTTVTGTVFAPNGTDPLPNVTVYIPTTTVDPFTPGVSCPLVGAPPSGAPVIGTVTDVKGHFTLYDVPVSSNIPVVIVSGRWRRPLKIPSVTACVDNPMPNDFAVMPSNHIQGDIPKIAIATGAVDQVECVLRKMGIDESEFTNFGDPGRINLYLGSGVVSSDITSPTGAGSGIDSLTPTQAALMGDAARLGQYDVLMLPCQGTPNGDVVAGPLGALELQNFIDFANKGGRVYSSHFSYMWMYKNQQFDGVVNWAVQQPPFLDGIATVDTSFTGGQTLAQWLQLPVIHATTTLGQMPIKTLRHDLNGVIAPTRSWLTLNTGTSTDPNPVMQFVFDTPIAPVGKTINQCGRVLFNEYHVEDGGSSPAKFFPAECGTGDMTPQEKLLEYMLFELTDDGGQPSLDPTKKDFGSQAIKFTSAPVTFTWTNNSSFTTQVLSASPTGDFKVISNNCSSVTAGQSCQIMVKFTPMALGAQTGTLTVASSGSSQTAELKGTGTPGFSLSATSLSFGSLDVTANASQTLTLTSLAAGPLPVPTFVTTGQYSVDTSACNGTLAALATCAVKVTFQPTTIGPQNGTVGVNPTMLLYSGLSATLTGNGVDFTISLNPTSGKVVAGDGTSTTATLTPLAGFAAPVSLLCSVAGATASGCDLSTAVVTPTAATAVTVSMTTTSQFTVVGFGGFGGPGYLWLVGLGTGLLLWRSRKSAGGMLRGGLVVVFLAAIGLSLSGCSGKLPTQNPTYTGPGSYTVKVVATDEFLTHYATYVLSVTVK